MPIEKKYSLWIMPEGNVYDKLSGLISKLAQEYDGPVFEPHLTLFGQVSDSERDLVGKAAFLAENLKFFEVKLTAADYLDEYFKCLFLKAEEKEDLMAANLKAREIFRGYYPIDASTENYMPHLSLLYANLPVPTKEEIISKIGKNFNISFWATNLYLVYTGGDVGKWYKAGEFFLK